MALRVLSPVIEVFKGERKFLKDRSTLMCRYKETGYRHEAISLHHRVVLQTKLS